MPHWLVRPHGAVVEPRGRQRVKVPKRCAEMCTHVPSHHLWCLYLYKVECKLYRFNFRMYVFFVTCWLKRNYAIRPSKDNANNSKIVAITKLDIQWQGGAQAMVMMVLFCTFNFRNGLYIYIYIHQSIFGRRRDTFAQSWCKKRGLSLMGTQLKRPQKRSTFLEAQKRA